MARLRLEEEQRQRAAAQAEQARQLQQESGVGAGGSGGWFGPRAKTKTHRRGAQTTSQELFWRWGFGDLI